MELPYSEYHRAASELFAIAACKLEDTLNPTTHITGVRLRAELELLPPPPFNQAGKYLPLIKPGSDWNARFAYIATKETLGLSQIRVPTEEGREIMHLEISPSFPELFLGFRISNADPANVHAITGIDGKPMAFESRLVERITDTLMQPLPTFSQEDTISDIQRKLAELKVRSTGWHSTDSVTTLLGPNHQLTVEKRTIQSTQPPDDMLSRSTSSDSQLILRVIRERVSPDGNRNQIHVVFHGADYFVHEPDITGRVLTPAAASPSGYKVLERYEPNYTSTEKLELMRSLTTVILNDLSQ